MPQLIVLDCDGSLIPQSKKFAAIVIYALVDPRNNEIRYIGKTKNPYSRLRQHFAMKKTRLYSARWIASLLIKNIFPVMQIIETIADEKWEEREIFWIKWGKENGLRLTNISGGGKGGRDRKHSLETRKLMSIKASGINSSQYGKPCTDSAKRKIIESTIGEKNHFYGKSHNEETKRRISEKKMGTPPPNRRAVIINGILYESVRAASIAFSVSEATIINRIRANCTSVDFVGYRYADEPITENGTFLLRNRSQTAANRKIGSSNKTGYQGVGVQKTNGKFRAYIKVNQKQIHIGLFNTAEEAYEAYKKAHVEHFGRFSPFYTNEE